MMRKCRIQCRFGMDFLISVHYHRLMECYMLRTEGRGGSFRKLISWLIWEQVK